MTDREVAVRDAQALYLGNLGTVEYDLSLPLEGPLGSGIRWESGNPDFLEHDGRVHRPAYGRGNREVELTAYVRFGAWEERRCFTVTVLEEGNRIEVDRILPIRLQAVSGKTCFLPGAAAVKTRDGRMLAHFIEWNGGMSRLWEEEGRYRVEGVLKDTQIPVTGQVEVRGPASRTGEEGLALDRAKAVVSPVSCGGTVTLLPYGSFYEAQERTHAWLLRQDPDQWLYNFRQAAGLPTGRAEPMTGWDSPDGLLRGHSTGHFLSSLALCLQTTGDERIRKIAVYMVEELRRCQEALHDKKGCGRGFLSAYSEEQFDLLEKYTPYPKIWAPYYTLHKILAGLIDLYQRAELRRAREVAEGVGDWICNRMFRLGHEQRMRMWSIYIAGEYGGMNESLAELYRITGEEKYLSAARCFDNDRLFFPLSQEVDALDGMHANQHIPQIIGALRMYEMTGELRYYRMAERFWRFVTEGHIYAPGGTGEGEMFHEPGNITGLLTKSTQESCASYNMLKLTGELYTWRPEAACMDYYERTLYNHILASCDHESSGASTYFLSMRPRAVKEFDLLENSCCHGTGLESPFKYGEYVYALRGREISVNLFLPSRLQLPGQGLTLRLETQEARPGELLLRLEARGEWTLRIRRPRWAQGEPDVRIDGKAYMAEEREGYWLIAGDWQGACEIRVSFPYGLYCETAPEDPTFFTLWYGPWLLAALTDSAERVCMAPERCLEELVQDSGDSLRFYAPSAGLSFIPLAGVWKEAYQVYLKNVG